MKIKTIDKVCYGSSGVRLVCAHLVSIYHELTGPQKAIKGFEAEWKKIPGDKKVLIATCPKCKKTTICIERRK